MKKKLTLGTILALSLVLIVSAAYIAPALAQETSYSHACALGVTLIDIPNHQPPIVVTVGHYDGGDHGVADYLELSTSQYVPQLGTTMWVTKAVMTDNPSTATFLRDFVFANLPGNVNILLVKSCQLQVYRIGKTVLAYWTVPLTSDQATLPAGVLMFKGYGSTQTAHQVWSLPNGWTLTQDSVGFAAHATLVCPSWRFCGTVGDENTKIGIDVDIGATHA
jgi:hypothetical protein